MDELNKWREAVKQHTNVTFEELKNSLLSDPDISNFIRENHMTDSMINRSCSIFKEYVQARDGKSALSDDDYYPILELYLDFPIIKYAKTPESIEANLKAENDFKTIDVLERESIIPTYKQEELFAVSFANFKAEADLEKEVLNKAKQLTKDYINGDRFNSIFIGEPGSGKTHLAMSILRNVNQVLKDKRALFVSIPELNRRIKEARAGGNWAKEGQFYELMTSADFLVLDDLGAEKSSEATQEFLYTIIEGGRNIIATTNNLNSYDGRIISRLGFGGKERSINFNGISDKRTKSF